ncbi:myocardin-related transcription factor A-like isoform X2 [Anoplopoma fimbria]|uniref:myocardin-related transcription factor A-like isoform X2 n=1 Tax=Anoplopoma fimbria TaxID=229290 RepID=UPI0023EC7A35|nr:myocardin-related transcription factor A-like isoform X2 [Anoplopoma fimbria]
METEFGERLNSGAFIPSPQSEALANELQELSLPPAPSLLRERKDVLQLKLQQRRSREELVNQGIMAPSSSFIGAWSTNKHIPALKSSTAFHEQRRSLERARTEDYLKRKIKTRPKRSELIRMHILEETSAEPSLQATQLQLKRARIADDLNDKISHRPGPMELIHKNILPVHSSIKQAFIETRFPKDLGGNSSCDEDSNYSLSPAQPLGLESPLGLLPLPSPPETLAGSSIPSPTQVSLPALALQPISGSSPSFKLTNGRAASPAQRTGVTSQIKAQSKPSSDRSSQRHKKPKDNKPKIKKLKYHQYIPPDQKGDKEPPPHLDSSYAKILQQQQLFLQLQILSQQQQHYNYHAILPAPPKPQTDQQPSSSSISTTTSSPPRPVAAPSKAPSYQGGHIRQSSADLHGTKPVSLPPNLDEMKVAELKSELKLRSLPVSGTKNDLIERLRTYQDLNGGSVTTSSPTAGGTTGPGAEGAGKSSKLPAATTNNTSQQRQQFQCHQTSSLTTDAVDQKLMTCSGTASPPTASLTHSDCSLGAMSPEDTIYGSNPFEEMMSSHITQVSLQPCSAAQLATSIKEEPKCSTLAPCQYSLKQASLQKHCLVSSMALTTTTTAPVVTMDKDRMLQEKDKQIKELTRKLMQKQRLVEVLRMQLEHENREGPEPLVLVRVKQEPPDMPSVPLSFCHPALSPPPSSDSCEMDVIKVTVKQEAIEAEEVACETTLHLPKIHGLPQTQVAQEQVQLQNKPEQMSTQPKQHVCLQQTALQLAQQQAIHKLLLQQQRSFQNEQVIQDHSQTPENLHKLSQQRKKKSHKQHLKQLQLQQQLLQSQQQQHHQQMQLKQQILLKQQKSFLQQQQQTKQLQQIQIQTKIHLKQQQVLIQQKQQAQQQTPQVSQASFNQQSESAPSFPLDLLKGNSTPTLVTDSNGNHFLVALTSHITEDQGTNAPGSKATNQIALQRLQSSPARLPDHDHVNQNKQSMNEGFLKQETNPQNGGLQLSLDHPQQDVALSLSAPPSLQPFFKDQETAPSGKTTSSPSSQNGLCPSLDVLFGPPSPASNKTAASSPNDKDTEHEEDFIDTILQTGEMSTTFNPAPDPSLDCLNPHSPSSSPHASPFQMLLSPPIPPFCDPQQSASSLQSDLQTLANTVDEKQHFSSAESGRLEDFLESTTGKPLLGVEPGGLLTLIDDLHSQLLCTSSILDHPLSPMDTFDLATEGENGLDSMDWLDLTMGGEREEEETSTLTPLGPQTPLSVFSTDFLDSSNLIHWDSCL